MLTGRNDYTTAVGFGREPAVERRRWFGRFVLALFVLGLAWLLVNGVISPEDTLNNVPTGPSPLPAPI